MDRQTAISFANEWVSAWNAHDLDRILTHYEDDFEMSSPQITKITGDASGTLKGKEAVSAYWAAALEKYPEGKFELQHVLTGSNSLTVVYQGVLGLTAEVFHFSQSGKVARAYAHYDL